MVAHARADHPDEACGIIAGPADSGVPTRHVPMVNAERSTTFYRFDPTEQLRLWRQMDDQDEVPTIIYHSHTATEAYPSRTDVSFAGEPDAHYVLISTQDPQVADVRAFRIVDSQVTEEAIEAYGEVPDRKNGGDPYACQSYKFGHSPDVVLYDC
ncbi:MAG TPA: M67 family metallopeptidase [Candidatus Stackebrandtia faecavium]|nr:M67 family metallopeptidase [Candidatus Stackebrandtia faecavium]